MNDLKENRWYCKLKEEALGRTLWRTGFGRGCGQKKNTIIVFLQIVFFTHTRRLLWVTVSERELSQCPLYVSDTYCKKLIYYLSINEQAASHMSKHKYVLAHMTS